MKRAEGKRGQVAIFLVFILAGLVLLFALNVDVFISSRAKIRIQNAADAGALALARWQGVSLNMIGDLNIARLAVVCETDAPATDRIAAMDGIAVLQRDIALMGPTMGVRAANEFARGNGAANSRDMTEAANLLMDFFEPRYRAMAEEALRGGVAAGVDNAALLKANLEDPRTDPEFYSAVANSDFRRICVRYAYGAHSLPAIPSGTPDPEEVALGDGCNACFGSIGIGWEYGTGLALGIGALEKYARDCGWRDVSQEALAANRHLLESRTWCAYNGGEWRELPKDLEFSRFPWISPVQKRYAITGGGATVRVEGEVALTSATGETNRIAALSAAKALGSVRGRAVTDAGLYPALVLPAYSEARLVPFAFGAATGRTGLSRLSHVRPLLGILGRNGGATEYGLLLDRYRSSEFRNAAEQWYSRHGHTDADGCCPPSTGSGEHGGGTPYGI